MTAEHEAWVAFIGLGANLPWGGPSGAENIPPDQTLRRAVTALGELGRVVCGSCLWRSEPVGPSPDQPAFTNGAVALRTSLAPAALLARLQDLEQRFGRLDPGHRPVQGPRTLDLDLLLVEERPHPAKASPTHRVVIINEAELIVPHPEMARRGFVLEPLAEIAPGLCHPLLHKSVEQLLRDLPERGPRADRLAAPGLMNG